MLKRKSNFAKCFKSIEAAVSSGRSILSRSALARIWMIRSLVWCLTILVFSFVGAGAAWAEVTPDEVRDAIAAGVRYLKSQQLKDRGSWPDRVGYPGGVTALCTLALLESGEPLDSPAMNKAMAYLRQLGDPQAVYVTALQTMVFCTAEPKKDVLLIQRNAEWLARRRSWKASGPAPGPIFRWPANKARGDNSNSQFALLGLHEAEQVGVKVDDATWQRALDYWLSCQRPDGAWSYYKPMKDQPEAPPTGSMTCAGIGALVMSQGRLSEGDARVAGGTIRCCCEQADDDELERALEWLGSQVHGQRQPQPRRLWRAESGPLRPVLLPVRRRTRRPLDRPPIPGQARLVPGRRGDAGPAAGQAVRLLARRRQRRGQSTGGHVVRVAVPVQGPPAGGDRQAAARLHERLGLAPQRRPQPDPARRTAVAAEAHVADDRRPRREGRGSAGDARAVDQRPGSFGLDRRAEAEPEAIRQPGRVHLGRGLLRRRAIRSVVSAADEGTVSGQYAAAAAARTCHLVRAGARGPRAHAAAVRHRRLLPDQRRVLPAGLVVPVGIEPRRPRDGLSAGGQGRDQGRRGDRRQRVGLCDESAAERQARTAADRRRRATRTRRLTRGVLVIPKLVARRRQRRGGQRAATAAGRAPLRGRLAGEHGTAAGVAGRSAVARPRRRVHSRPAGFPVQRPAAKGAGHVSAARRIPVRRCDLREFRSLPPPCGGRSRPPCRRPSSSGCRRTTPSSRSNSAATICRASRCAIRKSARPTIR